MAESRGGDCLIKLFGMTIPMPENGDAKDLQHSGSSGSSIESDVQENAHPQADASDPFPQPEVVDAEDPRGSPEQQQPDTGEEKEKLKKPDKVLPCPRCSSMDTKFCYFNNYNVNQPRHFCKNCQRYWTAGGAMRNVPVGAGRRKNKNAAAAASHFLQRVRAAAALPAGAGDPLGATNGTVLSFSGHSHGGPALDLAEHLSVNKLLVPVGNAAAGDPSVGSSSEGSSNRDDDKDCHGVIKEKVTMERPAANGVAQHPATMNGAAMWPYSYAPPPAYYSSGFAIPVYPAAPGYWRCMVPPEAWSLPWPVQSPSPNSAPSVSSSGPDHSLSLGKHPREGGDDEGRVRHGGGKVWAPKTIRIDDADEVARSSIWSLIGIKGGDKKDAADSGGAHKLGTVFEPKREAKTAKQAMIAASSPLLHANPVALTRSVTFQEGS